MLWPSLLHSLSAWALLKLHFIPPLWGQTNKGAAQREHRIGCDFSSTARRLLLFETLSVDVVLGGVWKSLAPFGGRRDMARYQHWRDFSSCHWHISALCA